MSEFELLLNSLQNIVQNDLAELFKGIGTISTQIPRICDDIIHAVTGFINEPEKFDVSNGICTTFLLSTLPSLCEVMFRRKTKIDHEDAIVKMFFTVIKLLSKSYAHEVAELCELRNYLLLGFPNQLKFINSKQVKLSVSAGSYIPPSLAVGSGFFGEFGKPSVAIKGSKYCYFWPDEWERDLGGFKAVGHFVNVIIEGNWRECQVLEYLADIDQYSLSYVHEVASGGESSTSQQDVSVTVSLLNTRHVWADVANKDRIGIMPSKLNKSNPSQQLSFSKSDVGQYLRVWWSKYKQYFYGKIISFDSEQMKHRVLYEDGDVREYEFLTSGKEFEVIHPNAEAIETFANLTAEGDRIVAIAKWHKSFLQVSSEHTSSTEGNSTLSATGTADGTEPNDHAVGSKHARSAKPNTVAPRPNPAEACHISLHQLALIQEYFTEGGSDAISVSLSKSTPVCFIIWLHLQLIYGMRHIISATLFKSIVWNAKEAIPGCLLRYDEVHIKLLGAVVLNDTLFLLKELMNLAVVAPSTKEPIPINTYGSSNSKASRVQETVDYLKLSVAEMLLNCSQLQKRYLGLSMMRDAIESCAPKIPIFVTKRSNYLLGTKAQPRTSRYESDGSGSNSNSSSAKIGLSGGQVERWLIQSNVIDKIFGRSLHQDLAAKSDTILVFLANRRAITEKHMDLLWLAARGAHEAVVRVVYHLILLLIPVLDASIRIYLFGLIASTPIHEITEQTLYLMKNFTVQAVMATKDEQPRAQAPAADDSPEIITQTALFFGDPAEKTGSLFPSAQAPASVSEVGAKDGRRGLVGNSPPRNLFGFSVLWQFIQDSDDNSGVEEHLVYLAIQLIVEMLNDPNCFKEEREAMMQKCLESMHTGSSVPVSLCLLRKILATYPTPSKSWFQVGRSAVAKQVTAASQIERLHKQHRLLEIFFLDFAKYQASMTDQHGSNDERLGLHLLGSSASAINDRKMQMNGKFSRISHLNGISERLEFLRFILAKSSITLSESHVFMLWTRLGKEAVTVETLDILVGWFESIFVGENKLFSNLVASMAQEADPFDSTLRSKFAFLGTNLGNSGIQDSTSTSNSNISGGYSFFRDRDPSGSSETASCFDENVLIHLFEELIVDWATDRKNINLVARPSVAAFCMKLFLLVNMSNKAIKVESDGTWARVGQLSGLPMLYRLAIDSSNKVVSDGAIGLLVELHHRIPAKLRGRESIRSYLLTLCFKKLSESMQSLRLGDEGDQMSDNFTNQTISIGSTAPSTPSRVTRQAIVTLENRQLVIESEGFPVVVPSTPRSRHTQLNPSNNPTQTVPVQVGGNQDDWFVDGDYLLDSKTIARRIARLILLLRLFIKRYHYEPTSSVKVQILAGRDESVVTVITLLTTDTIGLLRKRIGDYFKESPDNILIMRNNKATGILSGAASLLTSSEKFENDATTIRKARIYNNDSVIARRKENSKHQSAGGVVDTGESDSIKFEELGIGLLEVVTPIRWLNRVNSGILAQKDEDSEDLIGEYVLFSISSPPLPMHPDMTICIDMVNSSPNDKAGAPSAKSLPNGKSTLPSRQESATRLLDFLGPFIRTSPQYLDQLLEMLDGYLSSELQGAVGADFDISSAVWDVLQSLPTHPTLLKQVRTIEMASSNSAITQLLDLHSPYRLLYTLQIIDSLLSGDNDYRLGGNPQLIGRHIMDWALKFLDLGGLDHLLRLTDSVHHMISGKSSIETAKAPSESVCADDGTIARVAVDDIELVVSSGEIDLNSNWKDHASQRAFESVGRSDVLMAIHAHLTRCLHRLLLVDPLYYCWHISYVNLAPVASFMTNDINSGRTTSFPGIVLSCFNSRLFLKNTLLIINGAINAYSSNAIAASSLMWIVENSLQLFFGILTSLDDGADVFDDCVGPEASGTSLLYVFRVLMLKIPNLLIRQAACRRVFDAAANLWHMCMDASQLLSQAKKLNRVKLFDKIYNCIISAAELSHPEFSGESDITGQVYSLIAGLQAIQTVPELVLPMNQHGLGSQLQMPKEVAVLPVTSSTSVGTAPSTSLGLSQLDLRPNFLADMLCEQFMTKLMNHKSTESFHSLKADENLLGILRVLLILAAVPAQQVTMGNSTHDFIKFLYVNCLFPNSDILGHSKESLPASKIFGPVCQSKESRSLVYAILYSLCQSNRENYCNLMSYLGTECSTSAFLPTPNTRKHRSSSRSKPKKLKTIPWNYNPGSLVKEQGAFVGLSNQGGTCYMNSLLQQLFYSNSFSNGLLQVECKLNADQIADGQVDPEQDNELVLFQLQVLFGFLKVSQKRYYDTLPFCKVFKDYDGEPIRLGEQKDINEFAGMLFDKLESNPDVRSLLSNTIQGTFVWKTRSIETPYKSEREENFYMITAEVKNKSSLEESLELCIADELFNGENKLEDPDAKKKVDALRRCTIRKLPSTLIIHLKRFEFDIATMNRKKVNDLITFPMELNMYPYTEEGIAAREAKLRPRGNEYEVGALDSPDESAGTSDLPNATVEEVVSIPPEYPSEQLPSGDPVEETGPKSSLPSAKLPTSIRDPSSPYYHYELSGIVAHMGAIDSGHYYSFVKDPETQKWNEFNDRSVLPFSADDIPSECFGGEESYTSSTGAMGTRMKQHNAYLLFYRRKPQILNSVPPAIEANIGATSDLPHIIASGNGANGTTNVLDLFSECASGEDSTVKDPIESLSPLERELNYLPTPVPEPSSGAGNTTLQMNPKVLQAVWTANTEFQTDRFLYDATHFRFLWQLQHAVALEQLLVSDELESKASLALSRISKLLLRFNVEILSRARAHGCIPAFFERLEAILAKNSNRICAEAIVSELAQENASFAASLAQAATRDNSEEPDYTPLSKRTQIEKQYVQKSCHPWLLQMYLQCPHAVTVRIFSRFVLNCIKLLQPLQQEIYLSRDMAEDNSDKFETPEKSLSSRIADDVNSLEDRSFVDVRSTSSPGPISLGNEREESLSCSRENLTSAALLDAALGLPAAEPNFDPAGMNAGFGLMLPIGPESGVISDTKGFKSSITKFVHKLLLLAVSYQPEDIVGQSGYRSVTFILLQVSSMGYAEKKMLLAIGTIYRLVCSLLALNPSVTRIPTVDLQHAIDLVSTLVLATRIPKLESTASPITQLTSSVSNVKPPFISQEAGTIMSDLGEAAVVVLGAEDLQAFLNRIFLEDAITIGTTLTCAALRHICWSRGNKEGLKVLEFIAEKVTECVLAVGGANLAYRPYFSAISELLLGPAIDPSLAFDVIIPALVKKAEVLAVRQYPNDAEYIFAILKLINRIGLSSSKGHTCVMRLKDVCRNIHVKLEANRKLHPKIAAGVPAEPSTVSATTSRGGADKASPVAKDPVYFSHPGLLW